VRCAVCGARHRPADDPAGEAVDDEGDVGEVRRPERVATRGAEPAVHVVERAGGRRVGDGCPHGLAADSGLQAEPAHQPRHGAAGHGVAFTPELPLDLAHAVDAEARVEHARDFGQQRRVATRPGRGTGRVAPPGGMGVMGGWGDRQHLADRLDPIRPAVIVDEGDHGLDRRSSSARAEYADALRRISLAWRSSRFSRSNALMRSRSSVVGPARCPRSRSAWRSQIAQRLAAAADLCRDRADRRLSRGVLARVLPHQAHRPLANLRRKTPLSRVHLRQSLSSFEASGKSGAVQGSRPPPASAPRRTETSRRYKTHPDSARRNGGRIGGNERDLLVEAIENSALGSACGGGDGIRTHDRG
jgi:hypothetical protein